MTATVVSERFDYRDWTLTAVLAAGCSRHPDRVALRDVETAYTYRELWQAGERMAGGFAELGVTDNDRVLVMLDNSADYALVMIALNFLGAVAVPTNTMYKQAILSHVVTNSNAAVAVVGDRYVDALAAVAPGLRHVVVRGTLADTVASWRVSSFENIRSAAPRTPVARNVWDPLLIGYTSGTTGLSKGVVICNGQAFQVSDPLEVQRVRGDGHVFYVVCPMFHVTGTLGGVFGALIAGSTAHIGKPFSASSFFADVNEAGATHTLLVSAMVEFLLRQPPSDRDAATSLDAVYMVPLHPDYEEFAKRFGVKITTSYGSTEMGCVLVNEDHPDPARNVALRIRRGYEVRLVDEFDIAVPDGTPGHAIFRSDLPWLLGVQYQGNHEATAGAWRNGWLHSGDLMTRDGDGYFRYADRQRDAIRRRGENISSMEVEREVLRHEDVVECAAVGVASEYSEQEVKIFVVRRAGSTLTPENLLHFLVHAMPRYSLPRFIEFIDDLPRTATDKVRKEALRAMSNEKAWDREASGITLPR